MKKSIPEMNIDTRLILQHLIGVKTGEIVTYKTLCQLINRDVQREARNCLSSAMRCAVNQGHVFGTLRGIGIKRLEDNELSGIGEGARAHIGRTAKRAMKKMVTLSDFDVLTNEQKIRHNTNLSMLGVVAHISSPKHIKMLENKVATSMEMLPVQRTLQSFLRAQEEA